MFQMSQLLQTRIRKDGKSEGVAIRKNKSTRNSNTLKALFQFAYNEHIKKKNTYGKSKNKIT
jgi:hypothetical protein